MKQLSNAEIMLVSGGELNAQERFQHDGFLAAMVSCPVAAYLTYSLLGGGTQISTFVGTFWVFEAVGVGIGLAASAYFRK